MPVLHRAAGSARRRRGACLQRLNLAVVAKTPLRACSPSATSAAGGILRLLSSAGNTYNRDYLGENEEGWQTPMLNVFHRDGEMIRHFWGSELIYAPADPGRTTGTSAPSSRCGICST